METLTVSLTELLRPLAEAHYLPVLGNNGTRSAELDSTHHSCSYLRKQSGARSCSYVCDLCKHLGHLLHNRLETGWTSYYCSNLLLCRHIPKDKALLDIIP